MSRRTGRVAAAGLVALGMIVAADGTRAQDKPRGPESCYGAVMSALAARGLQPSDFGEGSALHDTVRTACAALDPDVQRFTVEIDGVIVGGVHIRLVPAN